MKDYRHIVWDWNGTLLDDTHLCVEIVNSLLARHELPLLDVESYRAVFDFPVKNYYERIGFDFSRESFESLGEDFINQYNRRRFECALFPGLYELIRKWHGHGWKHSIISASEQARLEEVTQHFGLTPFLHSMAGRRDSWASGKLHLGTNWIAQSGEQPADVVMIGDTVHDFEMAQAMGVSCILLTTGHQDEARLRACGVPLAGSVEELARLVE